MLHDLRPGRNGHPTFTDAKTSPEAATSALSADPGAARGEEVKITTSQSGHRRPGIEIESEHDDAIHVGAGGRLEIPHEEIDVGLDNGSELDLLSLQATKIRKPGRREWTKLDLRIPFTARLIEHRPKPDAIESEYYFVEKGLRTAISNELTTVRVIPFYSLSTKTIALWIVKITEGNSWYESIAPLFTKSLEFHASNVVRVFADRSACRYRIKFKPETAEVPWPNSSVGALLGDALGEERIIRSTSHPIYRELTDGEELSCV